MERLEIDFWIRMHMHVLNIGNEDWRTGPFSPLILIYFQVDYKYVFKLTIHVCLQTTKKVDGVFSGTPAQQRQLEVRFFKNQLTI